MKLRSDFENVRANILSRKTSLSLTVLAELLHEETRVCTQTMTENSSK